MTETVTAAGVLTIAEIERLYPDEWVLLVDLVEDPGRATCGGRVLGHSPDRDEVYRQLLDLRPARWATRYTGQSPEHLLVNHGVVVHHDP